MVKRTCSQRLHVIDTALAVRSTSPSSTTSTFSSVMTGIGFRISAPVPSGSAMIASAISSRRSISKPSNAPLREFRNDNGNVFSSAPACNAPLAAIAAMNEPAGIGPTGSASTGRKLFVGFAGSAGPHGGGSIVVVDVDAGAPWLWLSCRPKSSAERRKLFRPRRSKSTRIRRRRQSQGPGREQPSHVACSSVLRDSRSDPDQNQRRS